MAWVLVIIEVIFLNMASIFIAPAIIWGAVVIGSAFLSLGLFAGMGGFASASFGKIVLGSMLTAAGAVGGDAVATNVLEVERPPIVQDTLEDTGIVNTCSWEDDIVDDWDIEIFEGVQFKANDDHAYLEFKRDGKFKASLPTSNIEHDDAKVQGKYYCGDGNRMHLVAKIDKKILKEYLDNVPNVDLEFTVEYDLIMKDEDTMNLSFHNAYFGGEVLGKVTKAIQGNVPESGKEGYGCDLSDVDCWNATLYYTFKEILPSMLLKRA